MLPVLGYRGLIVCGEPIFRIVIRSYEMQVVTSVQPPNLTYCTFLVFAV